MTLTRGTVSSGKMATFSCWVLQSVQSEFRSSILTLIVLNARLAALADTSRFCAKQMTENHEARAMVVVGLLEVVKMTKNREARVVMVVGLLEVAKASKLDLLGQLLQLVLHTHQVPVPMELHILIPVSSLRLAFSHINPF